MNLFKLISVYEVIVTDQKIKRPLRIEILKSIKKDNFYRPRVWVKNMYNLYPSSLNSDENGNNLKSIHSMDELNQEISLLIDDDNVFLPEKNF